MYLTHKSDVFAVHIADKDDETILKELSASEYKMGRTSLRNLLDGKVSEACGFVLDNNDGTLPDEDVATSDVKETGRKLRIENLPTLNVATRGVNNHTEENEMVAQARTSNTRGRRSAPGVEDKEVHTTTRNPRRRATDAKAKAKEPEHISINEWIEKFHDGEFDAEDVETQQAAGWGEWGCIDSALPAKTKRLGRKMMRILNTKRFDPEETYVVFMNKSPDDGPRIDYFEIFDLETNEKLFSVTPRGRGANNVNAMAASHENDFKKPIVHGAWSDVVDYFTK